jgi:kynurenine formamidase
MRIIDLSVPIAHGTPSPPIVDFELVLTSHRMGPGFWQASKVETLLHTGSHVDFTKHYLEDGETATDVSLDRVIGQARIVDLTDLEPRSAIETAHLEGRAPTTVPGDILLLRTDWTDRHWGDFPSYYVDSPVCSPAAARWLGAKQLKAVGFDCFAEESAKSKPFSPEDFDVHEAIGDSGAIMCQQLFNLSLVPQDESFLFFAPFLKIAGGEGSPARFFALLDE